MNIPILIPAYKPDHQLIDLVEKLLESGITNIIVVDDGSGSDYRGVFESVAKNNCCHLCIHSVNLGKGRAIKTGLNYALVNFPELGGIVTADADGQHLPEDILKVQQKLAVNPDMLILGCRSFGEKIPFRSKMGNEITKKVFHLLTSIKVSDTQTGLRGIPFRYIADCIRLDGEKYEYEINMLVSSGRYGIKLTEVPIETVYIDLNRSSHFNPVLDSIKIYFVLFRFLLSSLTTALIDFIVFIICSGFGFNILVSTVFGRIIAGNYNFIINKNLVFRSNSNSLKSFVKYWLLVLLLGSLSYTGILTFVNYLGLNVLFSKALIETLLFFTSFAIQRNLVFNSKDDSNEKN
jgi:glycosyltransferase involved in cell wall biosynthesis